MKRLLALALVAAAVPAFAQGGAPFTVQETGRGYGSLQQAVDAIGGGSGTIILAPRPHPMRRPPAPATPSRGRRSWPSVGVREQKTLRPRPPPPAATTQPSN